MSSRNLRGFDDTLVSMGGPSSSQLRATLDRASRNERVNHKP